MRYRDLLALALAGFALWTVRPREPELLLPESRGWAAFWRWIRPRSRRARDAAEERDADDYVGELRSIRATAAGGRHRRLPVVVTTSTVRRVPAAGSSRSGAITAIPSSFAAAPAASRSPTLSGTGSLTAAVQPGEPLSELARIVRQFPEQASDDPGAPSIVMRVVRPNIEEHLSPYLDALPGYDDKPQE